MKRRIGVIIAITSFLVLGGSAAQAGPLANTTSAQWGCVGVQALDRIVCLSNPLPERLPLPN